MRMGHAKMIYTEADYKDFMTVEFLVRGGPRYRGRFDSCESVVGGLLLPKREPVGVYVISDGDCKI